jgi:hypothetical protein
LAGGSSCPCDVPAQNIQIAQHSKIFLTADLLKDWLPDGQFAAKFSIVLERERKRIAAPGAPNPASNRGISHRNFLFVEDLW